MTRSPRRPDAPGRPVTFNAAESLGAFELAQLWADRTAWPLDERTPYDELAELACMSALAAWLRRWQPLAIHGAMLAGAKPEAVPAHWATAFRSPSTAGRSGHRGSVTSSSTVSPGSHRTSTRLSRGGSLPWGSGRPVARDGRETRRTPRAGCSGGLSGGFSRSSAATAWREEPVGAFCVLGTPRRRSSGGSAPSRASGVTRLFQSAHVGGEIVGGGQGVGVIVA